MTTYSLLIDFNADASGRNSEALNMKDGIFSINRQNIVLKFFKWSDKLFIGASRHIVTSAMFSLNR